MGTIFGFNLKLRWKFLVVLLFFSLTPLIVVTIISYSIKTHDDQLLPNSVSFNHPVFLLAPGIAAEPVAEDIARLAGLIPAFRHFSKEFGHTLLWAYVSLQSGVLVSYPGHFGYPDDYDPRKRPWYVNAQKTAIWTRPLVDVTSGPLCPATFPK